jgi:hypothetical protein
MGKTFIINDTNITGGVASTHDIGTSALTWRHLYMSGTLTVGTVSATGAIIGVGGSISGTVTFGTVSAVGNIVGSATLTIGTGTIVAAKITATTGSFTALLTAGTASISGAIIGGTTITVGTVSATGDGIYGGSLTVGTGTIIAAKITASTVSATADIISGTKVSAASGSFTALVTAGTVSATGAGIFGGALSFSTAATMIGERAYVTFDFTSATTTTYKALPFSSKVIDCWTTSDTTPRSVSAFTLRAGSAGTVYVASVTSLVFNTAAGQQHQPTLTPDVITTASALNVTVGTSGSAGNFSATVVIQRTA